jgi:ribonuclease P protein component
MGAPVPLTSPGQPRIQRAQFPRESTRETNLSAKQAGPQAPPRLPQPHGDRWGPPGSGKPPRQGSQAPVRVRPGSGPPLSRPRSPDIPATTGLTRLKRRPEFLRVAGQGQKWATPGLVLQARRHKSDDSDGAGGCGLRVGFTVSRKVGNAVQRNRARRRLREVATRVLEPCAAKEFDLVIIGRVATLKRPFDALIGDLQTALRKLDVHTDDER